MSTMGCSCRWRSYPPFDPQEYYHDKKNWLLISNKTGSTIPVVRRYDSKQAFSTLQQFKEKQGAQRNQQLAQSFSLFSWWGWQGLLWVRHSNESHHGDEPSTDRTGWIVVQVLKKSSGHDVLHFIHYVTDGSLQLMAVYCNRRGV